MAPVMTRIDSPLPRRRRVDHARFRAVLAGEAHELRAVREALRAVVDTTSFADRADDVELALAELLANAQEHGQPPIEVGMWDDGCLVIEVRDRGRGFDHGAVLGGHPPAATLTRGRGLWIARQLSDGLGIAQGPDGTVVRMEFCADPQIGA
jgi:anti-sigma regulatory factor (Ser/Thr protein kinase)